MRHTAPKARERALLLFIFGLAALVSSCGGDGGNDGGGNTGGAGPLAGPPDALAASVIEDSYVEEDLNLDEFGEDDFGRPVLRTIIRIVFRDDATVGEVNELLIELSAQIVATLAGYPGIVVRIEDPGSYQALDTLVTEIESRGVVRSVLKSYPPQIESLPPNIEEFIFSIDDSLLADGWSRIDHHLAVRASAAWGVQSLIVSKPKVLIMDYFGAGEVDPTIFDVEPITGQTEIGIHLLGQQPAFCDTIPPANQPFLCKEPNHHGYAMTSVFAAEHSPANKQEPDYFRTTGMVPGGVQLGVVDRKAGSAQAHYLQFAQKFRDAALASRGAVVANLSIGNFCSGSRREEQCQQPAALQNAVIEFIREVQHAEVENRVLFVVAAGNRVPDRVPDPRTWTGPVDARTRSQWTASTLLDGLVDPATGAAVRLLTNVLVVENADHKDRVFNPQPPFGPGCIHESSFVGGHVAGVGMDVFWMEAPGPEATLTEHIADERRIGGTSAAAAQVSGIAAYLAALRPDLTPQQLITILKATAEPLPGQGTECTMFPTSVPVVDAYAAVLAIDPPHQIDAASAKARLELLDIFPDDQRDGDGVFDVQDLRLWIATLTNPSLPDRDNYHSRYDINGDGITGGLGTDRFDLDISMNPSGAGASPFDMVEFEFLGESVTYQEEELTDMQIVCYYANSDLYDLGGVEPSVRDDELETVRTLCDSVCNITFGTSDGYTLCSESATSCTFYTLLNDVDSCTSRCASFETTCLGSILDGEETCEIENTGSCDDVAGDRLCECEKPEEP